MMLELIVTEIDVKLFSFKDKRQIYSYMLYVD